MPNRPNSKRETLKLRQAMILTAGLSTRMLPLTREIPKILLPVIGKNLLERTMAYVGAQGIQSVSMNVFHGKKLLLDEIGRWKDAPSVTAFEEALIRGTGGGILGMKSFIKDDHFAVINCDFLTESVLDEMFEFHIQQKSLATLLLIPHPQSGKYGTVEVASDKKIKSFEPKGRQKEIFAGIHIMSREIFEHFPDDHNFCIIKNVYEPLIKKGAPIFGFSKNIRWLDLGEVALYHQSLFSLLEKPFSWTKDIKPSKNWVADGVKLSPNVACQNSIVESGIRFEGKCELKNTIVFPKTIVKPGQYQNAILTPNDTVFV